jgi:hypothetical protein
MKFGEGFKILDNFLLGLGRRDDIEYMLAPRTTDLDALGRNSRIV